MSENQIRHIIELPQQTADKIAAGEVIDRPLSIVKELVENSIDAGCTSIVVEIKNGGKSYIRVTDNGCGIIAEEAELAFRRHATSKLRTVKDLDAIETLGFRGEALASIAAVSRTELLTKTADETAGTSISIEGGVTVSVSETGCPEGTTIIVRDLFFNTPARLKFLKKDNTESTLIIDFISKIALAYPDIRVRLINNGNTLFSTPGKGDRFNAIATIYDPHTAKKLIKINSEGPNGLKLEGYISSPDETRANRKNQIFFVNGRYIQSRILELAISDGYREKLFEGRHPVVFLFLSIDPAFVDVNIHPNKKEIRFDDDSVIRQFVTQAIKQGLRVQEAVPEITFRKDRMGSASSNISNRPATEPKKTGFAGIKQEQIDIRKILQDRRVQEEAAKYNAAPLRPAATVKVEPEKKVETHDAPKTDVPKAASAVKPAEIKPAVDKPVIPEESKAEKTEATKAFVRPEPVVKEKAPVFVPSAEPALSKPFEVGSIRPIGTLFATYILGCDDDSFYMIDQHAAHERIFYEQLTREFYGQQTVCQPIMVPIKVEVTHAVKNRQDEWMDFLNKVGFVIEEFGPKSYAVKEIPMYMDLSEAELFINDFFDSLDEPGAFRDQRRAEKIIMKACKSAIKANDAISMTEVNKLLDDLAKTNNPFSCPHGRPTIIRMSRREVEALFKR
ncbi:MAG: DNA mismatch repair endonuclease MutL [Firmicutes bacterium]|nr:DNA mismatch repair endonuclease MutL [Bacillota bacterium]